MFGWLRVCLVPWYNNLGNQKTITLNLVTRLTEEQNSAGIFTYLNEYDQNLENKKYVDIWLNESFEGGRHQKRIDKLDE